MPFTATAADWQFFESESSSAIIPSILHSLESGTGTAVVTGPPGVGKTILLHHLRSALCKQGQALLVPGTSLQTAEDLYTCIRRRLLSADGTQVGTGHTRWEMVERLQNSSEFWGPIGLLVDDAHLAPPEIFTELQFLLEQRSDTRVICRVLLAGALSLEESLAQPSHAGFAQRVRTFSFLEPLRLVESVEYLRSRVHQAGGSLTECFDSEAVETIVEAADGIPRCLNLLADEALLLAAREGDKQVTRATVRAALNNLQHLPHAWNVPVADQHGDASLDDTVSSGSWASSGDGVIEIGAPPESPEETEFTSGTPAAVSIPADEIFEDVPDDVEDTMEVALPVETTHELAGYPDGDEFPPLGELTEESAASLLSDDFDQRITPIVSGDDLFSEIAIADGPYDRSAFDAGYRLAELQEVGDPAVDIDEDLDQRLLAAANALSDETAGDDAYSADIAAASDVSASHVSELVEPSLNDSPAAEVPQWQPAGTWPASWEDGSEVIRHWAATNDSVRADSGLFDLPDAPSVGHYSANVPGADEPEPVWPPAIPQLGPDGAISVTDVAASVELPADVVEPRPQQFTSVMADESVVAAGADSSWADGQLLSESAVGATADDGVSEEEDSEEIWLKLAEVPTEAADDSDQGSSPTSEPKRSTSHMFTLPIALDDVNSDCGPLVESVRELQKEVKRFGGPADAAPPAPQEPSPGESAVDDLTIEMQLQKRQELESSEESGDQLRRPMLIRQARELASQTAAGAALRTAAGAENSVIPEDDRPALSVISADLLPEETSSATETKTPRAIDFRNLFTRLRRRQG